MNTIESILSFVKTRLKITVSDEDIGLLDLINEQIRQFDCFETYINKRCPLEKNDNGSFCLPYDFYHELIVEGKANPFLNSFNPPPANTAPLNFVPILYYNETRLKDCGFNGNFPNGWESATCKINGNSIIVNAGFNAVVGVWLTYEAYNVDEHGRFYAPADFELAVSERIITEYMYDHRKNYAADTIQYHEKRADTLFYNVKSKSVIRDFRRNYAQIVDIANAILIDYNLDNGTGR